MTSERFDITHQASHLDGMAGILVFLDRLTDNLEEPSKRRLVFVRLGRIFELAAPSQRPENPWNIERAILHLQVPIGEQTEEELIGMAKFGSRGGLRFEHRASLARCANSAASKLEVLKTWQSVSQCPEPLCPESVVELVNPASVDLASKLTRAILGLAAWTQLQGVDDSTVVKFQRPQRITTSKDPQQDLTVCKAKATQLQALQMRKKFRVAKEPWGVLHVTPPVGKR